MAARIFLGLSALIWLPYGVLCTFGPAGLAESAGVGFTKATGATEIPSYTGMALGLELGTVALTTWLLRRSPARAV